MSKRHAVAELDAVAAEAAAERPEVDPAVANSRSPSTFRIDHVSACLQQSIWKECRRLAPRTPIVSSAVPSSVPRVRLLFLGRSIGQSCAT